MWSKVFNEEPVTFLVGLVLTVVAAFAATGVIPEIVLVGLTPAMAYVTRRLVVPVAKVEADRDDILPYA